MKPLILGVGNILLSDEGVGVRVVQELEKRPEIQPHFDIIDGGTCGMELLDAMANREHLIIVDAVLANKQPGEIVVLHDEQVPTFFSRKISPHQLGICDVLSAMRKRRLFRRRFFARNKTKNRSISPAHASWRSTRCNRPDGRTWAQREPWPRRRRLHKQR